jgi:ADP-ribose pyrophosphatase
MIFEEKTLDSKRIYEGRIINLRVDKVTVVSGTSTREIVEHNGGSVIAAITNDNKIIMVKQFRKPMESPILEVPAGKLDGDEDPADAALRELSEETGYTAGKLEKLTEFYPSVGYTTEVLHIYLATDLKPGACHPDENEVLEVMEMDLEEVYRMVMDGKIHDGKTIAAVMMARDKLRG